MIIEVRQQIYTHNQQDKESLLSSGSHVLSQKKITSSIRLEILINNKYFISFTFISHIQVNVMLVKYIRETLYYQFILY